jgi:hypothetical protein
MSINYYLIGSYEYPQGCSKYFDRLYDMISNSVVSIFWAKGIDMSNYYLKPYKEIVRYLESKGLELKNCSPFKHFLSIKPDDIMGIKKRDGKGNIQVRAYARVVERNGEVYTWKKDKLGHMINVEYLEKDVNEILPYNYARTIYHITDPERIKTIFALTLK